MYPPLDLRALHCFAVAAEAGTMTAAAERLHLSQSAVSLQIAALERRLDQQLLIRRRARTLLLTPAGRRLLPTARDLLAHAEEVQRAALARHPGVAGPLTVGCFSTAAPFLLPPLLQSFEALHPEVALDFLEGPVPEIETALRDGRCDLAIVDALELSPDVEATPLYSARAYALFAAGDELAARDSVTVEELAAREMVMFDLPPSRDYLESIFTSAGLRPRIRHRASSHELVRALVGRGRGFALLISRPVHDLTHEGLPLAAVPLAGEVPETTFALARLRAARPTRQAAAFARHCRERWPQDDAAVAADAFAQPATAGAGKRSSSHVSQAPSSRARTDGPASP
ncbi:MAG TPA: LysR substrate-binding domain-containing protein [Conexibacter sp.]|nr:LysR substrate-binding domain-containing protein [Conexibacter sp.]